MNSRRSINFIGTAFVLSALCVVGSVQAHNWGCWKQPNRTVYTLNTAGLFSQANAALNEWDSKTVLAIPRVNYHTDISVFDGYYGSTGWAGIASIESYSGCNILHGHARVNRSYSYTSNGYRGIFCQEIGHLFGLDHSNDGGCMGGGYYYSINTYYTVVSHNVTDIANKYAGVPLATTPDDAIASEPTNGSRAVAFWHDRPQTLQAAVSQSDAVVVASVLRVTPGPDLVVPVDGLEGGEDRIPTERVHFAVEKVVAGRMTTKAFELFRTGNAEFVIEEDPTYSPGERYVLFLTPREDGTYRVIAPEGRWQVTRSGLAPASTREFLSELKGIQLEALSEGVARIAPAVGENAAGLQLRKNSTDVFTSKTSVSYALPRASDVKLQVFDVRGRFVRTLVDAHQDAGAWQTVEWDGTDDRHQPVANGVYYIRLRTADGVKSVNVVRVK